MTVVEVAMACVGTKEGSQEHKTIIDIYNGYMDKVRPFKMSMSDPWCAAFVSACFIAAGLGKAIPIECSCYNMRQTAEKRRMLRDPGRYVPKPGDIVFYKMPGKKVVSHTGIVKSVEGSNMEVIEGNYKDSVGIRKCKLSYKPIDSYIEV